MLDIIEALRQCWEEKSTAALATIVNVDGSVYRKEGARCLIHSDGRIIGIVSGGCVEKDLFEHAQDVLKTGAPKWIEYDFRPSDDVLWGLGVGCNGALKIWIQPFDSVNHPRLARNLLEALEHRMSSEVSYIAGTVVESNDETKVPIGQVVNLAGDWGVPEDVKTGLIRQLIDGVEVQLFVEYVAARPRLIVFGAGADVKPLTSVAKFLEWHVVVVDHRPEVLNKCNFPDADEFVVTTREDYGAIEIPKSASVVIMTHNYEFDKSILRRLLPLDFPYIGQLGPRKRTQRIIDELASVGGTFKSADFEKFHSPIGLDIGAETPREIALCIVAEISARLNHRKGTSLRDKAGLIQGSQTQLGAIAEERNRG